MKKSIRDRICVYCAEADAATVDHVVSRAFFPVAARGGLPTAPACARCNGSKAQLEHHFTAVLPFGSDHPTALAGQTAVIERRLDQNARLRRDLAAGQEWREIRGTTGDPEIRLAFPFRGDEFRRLCDLILRGLVWHEWRAVVPRDYRVEALTLVREAAAVWDRAILGLGSDRRNRSLASGGLQYACTRNSKDPAFTAWHLQFYGGVGIAGLDETAGIEFLEVCGMTGPPGVVMPFIEKLKSLGEGA